MPFSSSSSARFSFPPCFGLSGEAEHQERFLKQPKVPEAYLRPASFWSPHPCFLSCRLSHSARIRFFLVSRPSQRGSSLCLVAPETVVPLSFASAPLFYSASSPTSSSHRRSISYESSGDAEHALQRTRPYARSCSSIVIGWGHCESVSTACLVRPHTSLPRALQGGGFGADENAEIASHEPPLPDSRSEAPVRWTLHSSPAPCSGGGR